MTKYKTVGVLDLHNSNDFMEEALRVTNGTVIPKDAIDRVEVIKGVPYIILKEEWRNENGISGKSNQV